MKRSQRPVLGKIQLSDGTMCVVRDRVIHALLTAQATEIERLKQELAELRGKQPGRIVLPGAMH